jgi:hypothetical protein
VLYLGKFSGLELPEIEQMNIGRNACRCPLCNEVFSTERNFVQHRAESRVGRIPGAHFLGKCRDPATKNLVLSHRGVWKMRSKDDFNTLKKYEGK